MTIVGSFQEKRLIKMDAYEPQIFEKVKATACKKNIKKIKII